MLAFASRSEKDVVNPAKVRRDNLEHLTDLPNVGPSVAADLKRLGIRKPSQLAGRDPWQLYEELCRRTGQRHDPCVIDVLMSITDFVSGAPPRPWWEYTPIRKRTYSLKTPPA
jgi:hypothetical protein